MQLWGEVFCCLRPSHTPRIREPRGDASRGSGGYALPDSDPERQAHRNVEPVKFARHREVLQPGRVAFPGSAACRAHIAPIGRHSGPFRESSRSDPPSFARSDRECSLSVQQDGADAGLMHVRCTLIRIDLSRGLRERIQSHPRLLRGPPRSSHSRGATDAPVRLEGGSTSRALKRAHVLHSRAASSRSGRGCGCRWATYAAARVRRNVDGHRGPRAAPMPP